MSEETRTVVALFAHPDDELGAIGTLTNHALRGDQVILLWTTYGELTTMFPGFTQEEIKRERRIHGEEIAKIVGGEAAFLDLGDSFVDISREHRVKVAQSYIKYRPDAVITWGMTNMHPDHRNTAQLAIDAVKFARINRIIDNDNPHRKNVKVMQYFEQGCRNPIKYVDVGETIQQVKDAVNFYADIYSWKNAEKWSIDRRKANGLESNCEFAEKYNVRFEFNKPDRFIC
ncbi:MAG: PIG-L family deacetylase [Candidatus Heimdallarchaeota archaeon]|nr:PIG-L family deacetylase [Candidatus Heimdallarchaeota archaeon]